MSDVHEIAEGIYRVATFVPQAGVVFAQFLINDEKPLLFHTGQRMLFPETVEGVRKVLDPARLRYVSWSHLESDESGALNLFLEAAQDAEPVHSELGALVNVNDFSIRPAKTMADGEVLDLGRHKLRFLVTPQVPHAWDAILAYEETTGTLMASDLFTQMGEHKPVSDADMIEGTVQALSLFPAYYAGGPRTKATYDRLIDLKPKVLACMHGPAFAGDAVRALRDLKAVLYPE